MYIHPSHHLNQYCFHLQFQKQVYATKQSKSYKINSSRMLLSNHRCSGFQSMYTPEKQIMLGWIQCQLNAEGDPGIYVIYLKLSNTTTKEIPFHPVPSSLSSQLPKNLHMQRCFFNHFHAKTSQVYAKDLCTLVHGIPLGHQVTARGL